MLLHLTSNRFYELNPTGARFWDLLSGGAARDQIEHQLLQEFHVPPAQLTAEIDRLLTELTAEGLICVDR